MQTEQEQARLNRSRLQETELLVIAWLMRRRSAAVKQALRKGRALRSIAAALESDFEAAVIEARQVSRRAARARLQQEFAARKLAIVAESNNLRALAADAYRARRVAESYAKRWLVVAERQRDESDEDAAAIALAATAGSVERIGASENAQAYNGERTDAARETGIQLWRVWDATLDAKTCKVCAKADGTVVSLYEPFPLGEPGDVHPFCRCSETFITER